MEEVVGELEELDVAILLFELLALTCELLVQDEGTGKTNAKARGWASSVAFRTSTGLENCASDIR